MPIAPAPELEPPSLLLAPLPPLHCNASCSSLLQHESALHEQVLEQAGVEAPGRFEEVGDLDGTGTCDAAGDGDAVALADRGKEDGDGDG